MKFPSTTPNASGLLYTLVAVTLLTSVSAQISNAPNLSTADKGTSTASGSTSASTSGTNTATGSNTQSTGSPTTGSNSATATPPRLTTSAAPGLTGLPKLANGYTIPTAVVPSTADAPFMKASNLPEGTIFIIVGAILGFMGFVVLAWRAGTAWSLHRAVKRAAINDGMDKKSLLGASSAPMYKYHDRESKADLGGFGGPTKNAGPKNPFAATSAQSLFFSPTAGAAGAAGLSGNRSSSYLPAGYYAAGAAAPGDGRGSTYIGSQPIRESISLANMVPQSQGYARATDYEPSSPGTPGFSETPLGRPQGYGSNNLSTSTLDLGRLPNGRAPSAVLDDLFDGPADNRRH